jgi:hypothetical protein
MNLDPAQLAYNLASDAAITVLRHGGTMDEAKEAFEQEMFKLGYAKRGDVQEGPEREFVEPWSVGNTFAANSLS